MEGSQAIAVGPPSRNHDQENFPVASLLLPRTLRGKVLAFYRFVRTADDIADSPDLPQAEKLRRLDALEGLLDVPDGPLAEVGTPEVRAMLSAFRQDAVQGRYADWAELEAYCARSAEPVGRLLLRLHGENAAQAGRASDALCTALQILNHLQDLVPDRETLDRIYVPVPWMAAARGEQEFFAPGNPSRRAVLDAALDRVEATLEAAAPLPHLLRSRLRRQASVTLYLAWTLLARLRSADPVLGRVALSRVDFARASLAAVVPAPSNAAVVRARVTRAKSSFARGMGVLKGERRRALFAVYGFCRAVDDIADAQMPVTEKRRFLAEWRQKLDAPDCALSAELAWARAAFDLPVAECAAMVSGMETDAEESVRLPDEAALDLYCRRVAGSVGAMAVRIFGAPDAEAFGLGLGRSLQLVNILRDAEEDAARNRVYVPRSLLAAHGVPDAAPRDMLRHPGFTACCDVLARRAQEGFARAEAELRDHDARALKPARIMMWGYQRLLGRMIANGFAEPRQRARLSTGDRVRMALLAMAPA